MNTTLFTPRTTAELADALGRSDPGVRIVAGGTDLMLELRSMGSAPAQLIDVSRLHECAGVRETDGYIRIGAATTFAALERDPLLRARATCLATAATWVGSQQIRNMATIGGNVVNASACADALPPLVALGAEAEVLAADGSVRHQPLSEFVLGTGRTTLGPREALVAVRFHTPGHLHRSAFAKLGARAVVTITKLSIAIIVAVEDATITDARVALGSLAPIPFRHADVESALLGAHAEAGLDAEFVAEFVAEFAAACVRLVDQAIPSRTSRPYKRHAVAGVAYDAWNALGLTAPLEPTWTW